MSRRDDLERHGRVYGELHLPIAFTVGLGLENDDYKTAKGWQKTRPLPDGDFGAAHLAGRGERRNPVVVLNGGGLLGVDVDGPKGRAELRKLVALGLPRTISVRTGRADGGFHLWYRSPGPASRVVKIELAEKVKLVRNSGYLVAPPAVYAETGALYEFVPGYAAWECELATFPAELLERLERDGREDAQREREDDSGPVPEGRRHDHLFRLACAMRRVGAGEPTILAALLVENERRCVPPHSEQEVRDLTQDVAKRYEPGVRR